MKNFSLIIVLALLVFGAFLLIPGSKEEKEQTMTTVTASADTATKAVIETDKGKIELDLYPDVAPKTVANFIEKARSGFFDGLRFHRVEDWVIQAGDPLSRDEANKSLWGTGGEDIETELSQKPFMAGALGVARGGDIKISNDSQFFIVKSDSQFLDGKYTLFGQVTSGMDVAEQTEIGDLIKSVTVK